MFEHPAYSDAWARFGLPRPNRYGGWSSSLLDPGWSCHVEQGRYGLPVKKATWLYACGAELPELRWGFTPDKDGTNPRDKNDRGIRGGLHAWRDAFGGRREQWTDSKHRGGRYGLSSTTPPEFRDVLLRDGPLCASVLRHSPTPRWSKVSPSIPAQGGYVWDEHRNTSKVWPVPPDALLNALRALKTLDPALRQWIEEGHPLLTEAEHFERFGESYKTKPRQR